MHEPADIGGELLRLGAGQQHAVVQRVQEPVLADPALLLDEDAVHDRDLAGRSAEAESSATRSQTRNASARLTPWRGRGRRGRAARRERRLTAPAHPGALGCLARPVVGLVRSVAAPAVEGVVEQHPSLELFQVLGVHAREPERGREQARASGTRSGRAVSAPRTMEARCWSGSSRQAELLDHDVEGAQLAAVAPEHALALDVERRALRTDRPRPAPRRARRTGRRRSDRRSGGSAMGRRCGRPSAGHA